VSLSVPWYPVRSEMVSHSLWNIEEKMRASIEVLKRELAGIRTGHATPTLIEHIKVEYAGVPTPLNQIAGISAPGANLLVIQPWDQGCIHSIEKAILKSDLGLTPVSDGKVIRLNIPPVTEERRQELIRVVRKRVEERKVAIRNLRHEAMDELKGLEKNKDISQDELKRALDQLQKLTDSFIANTDQVGQDKEAELIEV
jgi:ribosome recycling factor